MGLDIKCYPDGMYGENTYLITDEATGFKAIIDPGYYGVDVRMDIQNNAYLKYAAYALPPTGRYSQETHLFRLSVGRTDLPTGNWYTLLHSINDKLYTLMMK